MSNIPYVCLYASYLQTLSPFSDAEKGRIMTAMLNFAATGEVPEFDGNERFIWPSIQAQIQRDVEAYQTKCAKNKSNGSKGGRPPKNPTVISETDGFSEEPTKAKEKKKEKEREKKKEKEREKDNTVADKPPTHSRFSQPTVEQVQAYCTEKGYSLDAEHFVDYYTSNGWMVGKNRMKDWKAAVRTWSRKETPNNGKTGSEQVWPAIGTVV